jgi:SAM-dependent methyltransferase
MEGKDIRKEVKERYGDVAKSGSTCCGPSPSCGGAGSNAESIGRAIGYSEEELKAVPEGANLGLGCGNPTALASLQQGETVLDLGSGAGFDAFLAAEKVGEKGRVIGVDMTEEMIDRARENARRGPYPNVEFRLGEIESIPVGDAEVDVVISNCVINLSPEKPKVFREAFRVLKPGGRIMVSDIVLERELPDFIRSSVEAWTGCIAGADLKEDYLAAIGDAGFEEVEVVGEAGVPFDLVANDPTARAIMEKMRLSRDEAERIADTVVSVKVMALKPPA